MEERIEPRIPECILMSVSLGYMFTIWDRSKMRMLPPTSLWCGHGRW